MKRPLAVLLALGMAVRVGYVLLQPRFDPTFARPILDGAHYVELARQGFPWGGAGPFYMPPLYPAFLSAFLALFGDAWTLLYILQHALVVLAAGALALVARNLGGARAGIGAAAIVLLYHPAMFFASRPLGEALALALTAGGLALASRAGDLSGGAAGLAGGLAALVRPNLLPLPFMWGAAAWWSGRRRRAALVVAAAIVAIVPVTVHNLRRSGSFVPVSANGGVVFWLGNAPEAIGVYTPVPGFSGALETQQAEAIAEASARSGRPLDAVGADRFWLREGLAARAASPLGTAVLLARRTALTLDDAEHGLDYAPGLDRNPLRWLAPIPFAAIAGLAVAGVVLRGFRGTGGGAVWGTIAWSAVAPLAFYVSSRHRLPLAVLLAVPAGVAAAEAGSLLRSLRGRVAAGAGLATAALSLALPTGAIVRSGEAGSLAVLANVALRAGDVPGAEAAARRAVALDPECVVGWYNLGVIEQSMARRDAAEAAYRAALAADPGHAESAGNLSALLLSSERAEEAVTLLRAGVVRSPRHAPLWANLVVGLVLTGRPSEAREAIEGARRAGVALNPGLVESVMTLEDPKP